MTTITQLSDDLIFIILENEIINVEDIVNFKSTCERFQNMILSNKFWEKKYYQSCPIADKSYNKEKQKKIFPQINFKERIKIDLNYIQMLKYYVVLMSENKLHDIDKTHLEGFLLSIAKNSMTYYFVWDEINRMSAKKSRIEMFSDLTREYNFKLLFYCLKQYRFIYTQIKFLKMPTIKLLLEKQLTIMAQYFVPHVLFSCKVVDDSESKQIMDILEKYIFLELEVHELYQLLMLSPLETKYIKYIGDCFRIYLSTVKYHIVAQRLGIHSHLKLNDDIDIVVIWKPRFNTNNWNYEEYFYMVNTQHSNNVYPLNIIRRIYQSNNFTMETLEDDQIEVQDNFVISWNFNVFLKFLDDYCMIVGWHLQYNEKDKLYKYWTIMFPNLQRRCIYILTLVNLKNHQSLYIILTDNDRICYIREGMLFSSILIDYILICFMTNYGFVHRKKIKNIEFGTYFYHFKDTHYVPNASLKKHYPKDTSAIVVPKYLPNRSVHHVKIYKFVVCYMLYRNFFMNILMYFEDFRVKIVIFKRKFKK
ncbi:hypothetical protein ACFW04_011563 [Cataglyphis niger]